MAQYAHKVIGLMTIATFLTLTSLDLNTHLKTLKLTDRVQTAHQSNKIHVAIASNGAPITYKIRQANVN